MAEPGYRPFGWEQWPDFPWWSYQFRRVLGETQEGGGAISECFMAADKMRPGDGESWYREWRRLADRIAGQAAEAEAAGHAVTARNAYLRATNYYRASEYGVPPSDARRLESFDKCEECFQKAGRYLTPPLEIVRIPYEGTTLPAYFLRPSDLAARWPVLVSFGGLDSFKEELFFRFARGARERGIASLLVDGPGQGAAIRRQGLKTRYDYEVAVGACVDTLLGRSDVDPSRIAVSGASLGGYYAARAAAFEHRLAAAISSAAQWDLAASWRKRNLTDENPASAQIKWVFGGGTMAEVLKIAEKFTLEVVIERIRCPYLIIHGSHDHFGGQEEARIAYEAAKKAGVKVTLLMVTPEQTAAEHCQLDNPTLGEDLMFDWLSDVLVSKRAGS